MLLGDQNKHNHSVRGVSMDTDGAVGGALQTLSPGCFVLRPVPSASAFRLAVPPSVVLACFRRGR